MHKRDETVITESIPTRLEDECCDITKLQYYSGLVCIVGLIVCLVSTFIAAAIAPAKTQPTTEQSK